MVRERARGGERATRGGGWANVCFLLRARFLAGGAPVRFHHQFALLPHPPSKPRLFCTTQQHAQCTAARRRREAARSLLCEGQLHTAGEAATHNGSMRASASSAAPVFALLPRLANSPQTSAGTYVTATLSSQFAILRGVWGDEGGSQSVACARAPTRHRDGAEGGGGANGRLPLFFFRPLPLLTIIAKKLQNPQHTLLQPQNIQTFCP